MGKWQKALDQVLKQSEKNKKILEESAAYYQKVVESAQTFTAAYTKAAPQFGKTLATLLDLAEECARGRRRAYRPGRRAGSRTKIQR